VWILNWTTLLGVSAEQVLCLLLHLAIRYMPKTPIHTYLSAAHLYHNLGIPLVDWCRSLAVVNCIVHWKILTSVATLLLRKNTRFHDKKNTRFTKKTLDYKSKLTHSENVQKMRCNANHRHCAIHCQPQTKKREIAATFVFVCTGHWNF